MRRALRWLAWGAGGLVVFLALLLGAVILLGNIGPGQRLLASLVGRFTAGEVTVAGLGGWFPGGLRIETVKLNDPQGTYLTLHNVRLDWSPWQLVHGTVDIDRLAVANGELARLPQSSGSSSSSSLPVSIRLHSLQVSRLDLAPAVAGQSIALGLDGSGTIDSLSAGHGQLAVKRLNGAGSYSLDANVNASRLRVVLNVSEPEQGLIATATGLPKLGAIAINATLDGPRDQVATDLTVQAGQLHASAHGTLDLVHDAADLAVSANAPAMQPGAGLSWQSIAVDARAHGPFDQIDMSGKVRIEQLEAYGSGVRRLTADVSGNAGLVHLTAQAEGLRIVGAPPDLLAGAPMVLDATAHLAEPRRPVTFTLHHPLLAAEGSAQTAAPLEAHVRLELPQLAPFAAVAGATLQGHTRLDIDASMANGTTTLAVNGSVGLNAGPGPSASLLGTDAHLALQVSLHGQDVTLTRFAINGQDARASVHGTIAGGTVNLDWAAALSDLSAVRPTLQGNVQAQGHVGGTTQDLSVAADVSGHVATEGVNSGEITAHLEAQGLPTAPRGHLTAQGTLLGAPLELAVAVQRQPDGAIHASIDRADWKSAHAEGALTVNPPALVPQGQLRFSMSHLADLAPLLGRPIAGSIQATLDATANEARLTASARDAGLTGTAHIGRLSLQLAVADPTTHPVVNGDLTLDEVSASGVSGSVKLHAEGPQDALSLKLGATLPDLSGAAVKLDAAARVNVPASDLTLTALRADWKQRTLRLQSPAQIGFGNGVTIDNLRLALDRGTLTVNGKVGTTLDLDARLRDLPADIATVAAPDLAASGTISAEAHLTGTVAQPSGTIQVTANGLRLRSGPGGAMPPANLTAKATLETGVARLDARLSAGSSSLTVTGTAPVTRGALDLRAKGAIDLAMANPMVAAAGRRVTGRLTLDARITGTTAAPRVAGTAHLVNAEVQDYTFGVHLRAINATAQADGERIQLTQFSATAGAGTVTGSGTISLAPPMPVNLVFTATNATPIANDVLTERVSAHLTVAGEIAGNLSVRGTVQVLHAEIQIPEKLPQSVAVLPLRNPRASAKPAAAPGPAPEIGLDLTIHARQVFVRGRGLDADLAGTIRVQGTAAQPQPSGGLTLQHGTFSLAGQTLTFSEGTVDFIGAGITDPALHFVATTSSNNVTATLTIGGTAHNPKITLSSVPQLPQDEILAQVLFHRSVSSLSPFEVAQIAAAIASFSGATSGLSPLADLRKSLGLDRLSIGTNSAGNPTVQGGRYIAPGVYLGAKQNATGGGTQANLQIDIAKGLKLETTTGVGGGTSPGASSDSGSSVGLTYQFEY